MPKAKIKSTSEPDMDAMYLRGVEDGLKNAQSKNKKILKVMSILGAALLLWGCLG
jgi:hypothetical protein